MADDKSSVGAATETECRRKRTTKSGTSPTRWA